MESSGTYSSSSSSSPVGAPSSPPPPLNESILLDQCQEDVDCQYNMVCYSKDLRWNTKGYNFCDCSSWFALENSTEKDQTENGHEGSSVCTVFSTKTRMELAFQSLLCIGYGLFFFLLLFTCYHLYRQNRLGHKALYIAFGFHLMTNLCGFVFQILAVLSITQPENQVVVFNGEKVSIFYDAKRIVFLCYCLLLFLGFCQIGLAWYGIAVRSLKMRTTASNRERRLRNLVIAMELVLTIFFFCMWSTGYAEYVIVLGIPYLFFIGCIYAYGAWKLTHAMKPSTVQSSRNDKSEKTLRLIQNTAVAVVSSVLFTGIMAVAYGSMLYFGWKVYTPLDTLRTPIVYVNSFMLLGFFISCMAISLYLYSTIRSRISINSGRKFSGFWSRRKKLNQESSMIKLNLEANVNAPVEEEEEADQPDPAGVAAAVTDNEASSSLLLLSTKKKSNRLLLEQQGSEDVRLPDPPPLGFGFGAGLVSRFGSSRSKNKTPKHQQLPEKDTEHEQFGMKYHGRATSPDSTSNASLSKKSQIGSTIDAVVTTTTTTPELVTENTENHKEEEKYEDAVVVV